MEADIKKTLMIPATAKRVAESRRKHNRITQDRMVGILADVARIEYRDVRISIMNKNNNTIET